MLDESKTPVLFSAGTKLAYCINKYYYGNVHYVWCTDFFHSKYQPITSDPQAICARLIEIISTEDRNAREIEQQKVGILKGAVAKLKEGVISAGEYRIICEMVNGARYSDFTPILYVISSAKVKDKCKMVGMELKASDTSIEYLIPQLSNDEFQVIDFKQVFRDQMDISDKKAGE